MMLIDGKKEKRTPSTTSALQQQDGPNHAPELPSSEGSAQRHILKKTSHSLFFTR
jgi:hypothetical protein